MVYGVSNTVRFNRVGEVIGLEPWMGPNYSISSAYATSNFCILSAANHIIRGEAVSVYIYSCSVMEVWESCIILVCIGSNLENKN
jgi:hypothetical protein